MIWKEAGFCNSWEVLWQNQEMGKVKLIVSAYSVEMYEFKDMLQGNATLKRSLHTVLWKTMPIRHIVTTNLVNRIFRLLGLHQFYEYWLRFAETTKKHGYSFLYSVLSYKILWRFNKHLVYICMWLINEGSRIHGDRSLVKFEAHHEHD